MVNHMCVKTLLQMCPQVLLGQLLFLGFSSHCGVLTGTWEDGLLLGFARCLFHFVVVIGSVA